MTTTENLIALRQKMQEKNINAFIVYSADPHMSEYLPEEWQERAWLSGFTGSAGFVVITDKKSALWTDGRYFVQAEQELANSEIKLMKEGVDDTPDYIDWIFSQTPENGKVAVNAIATSHANWQLLEQKLSKKNIILVHEPLLEEIWTERAKPSKNEIFVHPLKWAGKSVEEKLNDIRIKMQEQEASLHIISSLDDVAWTLNLRGSDVDCNPVFLGYIALSQNDAILFVDLEKLNHEAKKQLELAQIKTLPYDDFFSYLETFKNEKILISPNSNHFIFKTLGKNNEFIKALVPGNLMKAIKNETELEGFRNVMVRDGVAMVKFLYWLKHNVGKEPMTEFSIGQKLKDFRAEGENFVGESFGSIIGYKGNGAIVHYSAKKREAKKILMMVVF